MKKIIAFITKSNHLYHFMGGFLVSWLASTAYDAVYASIVAASCLEFKDKHHGGVWDWVDWAFTMAGGVLGAVCRLIL